METVEILLIIISILLFCYSIYIYLDQKHNLRFSSPKSKMVPLVALLIVVIGFANYLLNGYKTADLGAAIVLGIFAFIMAISRNGIGETGLYFEGMKVSWKQISKVSVEDKEGDICLNYTRKKATRTLVLSDTTIDEVTSYLKKLRKIYHFEK